MEPREVQKYIHTPGTQKMIRRANFLYLFFYKLYQHQEKSHQKRTKIRPQVHHTFQRWYKGQVPDKLIGTWCKSQP